MIGWMVIAAAMVTVASPAPGAATRAHSYDVLIRRIDHFVDHTRRDAIVDALRARRVDILALPDNQAYMAAINAVLRDTAHDRHLQVVLESGEVAPAEAGDGDHGIAGVTLRPDGIGVLRLDGFSQSAASIAAIDRATARLAGARALILDLRRNGGGGETSYARLLGHMFARRTELNGIAWRTCVPRAGLAPDACEQGPPRVERRFTDVPPHPAFARMPVYVLVSPHTFSAAEAAAYELQQHHRATVVGEPTGGGASPSAAMDLESAFAVIMPIGRLHRVTAGTGWEGTGVIPDVRVAADRAEARALALIGRRGASVTPR